jgi:hypothetical protein
VLLHLLRTGAARKPYGFFKAKLRGVTDAQLRSLLMDCGATSAPHRVTRREMWGLPSRA